MYVSLNNDSTIQIASKYPINVAGRDVRNIPDLDFLSERELIGRKLVFGIKKRRSDLNIAIICNYGDRCGIATYTEFLINALRPKVNQIKIFAEDVPVQNDDPEIERCWVRGQSMVEVIQRVIAWKPDFIFVQHEFGIFPKATHFLKMLELLDPFPYVITTHSVYEHLDKTVCTSYVKNTIVHSEEARQCLIRNGHTNPVHVIPHGCVIYEDNSELWNIFQNDYSIIQFGFGFGYKGVDVAVDAIRILKSTDVKFKDIFYCYLCSESYHTRIIQEQYYREIQEKVQEHGLEENVVVLRGYASEQHLQNFMRTAKLAIFPYKNNPNNVVYGASGAIRKSMACGIPIIASDSHMFDDLEGVVPRPADAESLAKEIDRIFSNNLYREELKQRSAKYIQDNCWTAIADKHLMIFESIMDQFDADAIRVTPEL